MEGNISAMLSLLSHAAICINLVLSETRIIPYFFVADCVPLSSFFMYGGLRKHAF